MAYDKASKNLPPDQKAEGARDENIEWTQWIPLIAGAIVAFEIW